MHNQIELDKIDIYLLRSLGQDGRKSFTDLAHELDVSVGMVRNRYNRLVESGILHIVGWTDPVKNGMNAYARIVITIRPTSKIKEVAEKLTQIDEVSFVAITTGSYDLEINVTCRNNAELLELMHQHINTIEGVHETNTTMYLQIMKWAAHNVSARFDNENRSLDDKRSSGVLKNT
jgi:Lrp/AsnC family transcriptional regulator for asnA, asnC and gidA